MSKYFKFNPLVISLFSILIGVVAYLIGVSLIDLMELETIDLRFQTRRKVSPRPEVVLAVIDEKSVAQEGKWPWPRSKIADLVNKLSQAGSKVIAFDIVFAEPDDQQLVQTIAKIKRKVQKLAIQNIEIQKYLENLKLQTDNDKLLADAIKNSTAKIVLGHFFQMEAKSAGHISAKELLVHEENVKGSTFKFIRYTSKAAQNIRLYEAVAPQSNIKKIADPTEYSGFFNMEPDPDGTVRWIPGIFRFRNKLYAPLSLSTVSAYLDAPLSAKVAEFGVEEIELGALRVPTDELGRMFINYRGKGETFPHIPITDILNDRVPVELLKDKIVIVGATAVGIYDLRVTPFSNIFPGLEIHANIVDSILSKDFLQHPGWATIFDIMAIIITGTILGLLLPRVGAVSGSAILCGVVGSYIVLCQYLFSHQGFILNLVYPVLVAFLIYVGITVHKYMVESSQKRFIRDAFSTYLAPSVVKQIIDSPQKLVLGGELREITAFFSDLQGFTGISEKLTAPELVELLNEFLTEMTDIILNFEGTLDKFEGDAIIAFFGAPNYLENHAETAARASIEMQKRLVSLRTKWKSESRPELKMRIGLCSGPAVVGNMGSKSRMDYTMMGDTVNTAARLEGVNKVYGTYTLIGEPTYQALGPGILTREIDSINVVGKKEAVAVYQLLGYREDFDSQVIEMVNLYTKGLYAYRGQDWANAIDFFNNSLKINPDDGPSRTMISRCNEFKLNSPGKEWGGTYTMTSKQPY